MILGNKDGSIFLGNAWKTKADYTTWAYVIYVRVCACAYICL